MTINNDTVYSMAQLDLAAGRCCCTCPTPPAATTCCSSSTPGRTTSPTSASAPPARRGRLPARPARLGRRARPTTPRVDPRSRPRSRRSSGAGRCDGDDDLPAVHALQDATDADAVRRRTRRRRPARRRRRAGEALDVLRAAAACGRRRSRRRRATAAAAALRAARARRRRLAVRRSPTPTLAAALAAGSPQGKATLRAALTSGTQPAGERLEAHLPRCSTTTSTSSRSARSTTTRWKIADPAVRIVERAAAALRRPVGQPRLRGRLRDDLRRRRRRAARRRHRYTLRFDPTPPVDAFWSLTMYDVPDFYLVANPIDRYSIGDRTPGIVHDDDGALTITMQPRRADRPAAGANWLPAPAGAVPAGAAHVRARRRRLRRHVRAAADRTNPPGVSAAQKAGGVAQSIYITSAEGQPASRPSRSACSTRSPRVPPGWGSSGRSPARPRARLRARAAARARRRRASTTRSASA